MSTKAKKDKGAKNDPFRFEGDGISFKGKLIGSEAVSHARGDRMCADAMTRLKSVVKASGEHKQRVSLTVSLEGIKVFDEKTHELMCHHPVHRISFISQDQTDPRAFGYVSGTPQGGHSFIAIKTEKAASQIVIALRDLFQVVLEMKQHEMKRRSGSTSHQTNNSTTNMSNNNSSGTNAANSFSNNHRHSSSSSANYGIEQIEGEITTAEAAFGADPFGSTHEIPSHLQGATAPVTSSTPELNGGGTSCPSGSGPGSSSGYFQPNKVCLPPVSPITAGGITQSTTAATTPSATTATATTTTTTTLTTPHSAGITAAQMSDASLAAVTLSGSPLMTGGQTGLTGGLLLPPPPTSSLPSTPKRAQTRQGGGSTSADLFASSPSTAVASSGTTSVISVAAAAAAAAKGTGTQPLEANSAFAKGTQNCASMTLPKGFTSGMSGASWAESSSTVPAFTASASHFAFGDSFDDSFGTSSAPAAAPVDGSFATTSVALRQRQQQQQQQRSAGATGVSFQTSRGGPSTAPPVASGQTQFSFEGSALPGGTSSCALPPPPPPVALTGHQRGVQQMRSATSSSSSSSTGGATSTTLYNTNAINTNASSSNHFGSVSAAVGLAESLARTSLHSSSSSSGSATKPEQVVLPSRPQSCGRDHQPSSELSSNHTVPQQTTTSTRQPSLAASGGAPVSGRFNTVFENSRPNAGLIGHVAPSASVDSVFDDFRFDSSTAALQSHAPLGQPGIQRESHFSAAQFSFESVASSNLSRGRTQESTELFEPTAPYSSHVDNTATLVNLLAAPATATPPAPGAATSSSSSSSSRSIIQAPTGGGSSVSVVVGSSTAGRTGEGAAPVSASGLVCGTGLAARAAAANAVSAMVGAGPQVVGATGVATGAAPAPTKTTTTTTQAVGNVPPPDKYAVFEELKQQEEEAAAAAVAGTTTAAGSQPALLPPMSPARSAQSGEAGRQAGSSLSFSAGAAAAAAAVRTGGASCSLSASGSASGLAPPPPKSVSGGDLFADFSAFGSTPASSLPVPPLLTSSASVPSTGMIPPIQAANSTPPICEATATGVDSIFNDTSLTGRSSFGSAGDGFANFDNLSSSGFGGSSVFEAVSNFGSPASVAKTTTAVATPDCATTTTTQQQQQQPQATRHNPGQTTVSDFFGESTVAFDAHFDTQFSTASSELQSASGGVATDTSRGGPVLVSHGSTGSSTGNGSETGSAKRPPMLNAAMRSNPFCALSTESTPSEDFNTPPVSSAISSPHQGSNPPAGAGGDAGCGQIAFGSRSQKGVTSSSNDNSVCSPSEATTATNAFVSATSSPSSDRFVTMASGSSLSSSENDLTSSSPPPTVAPSNPPRPPSSGSTGQTSVPAHHHPSAVPPPTAFPPFAFDAPTGPAVTFASPVAVVPPSPAQGTHLSTTRTDMPKSDSPYSIPRGRFSETNQHPQVSTAANPFCMGSFTGQAAADKQIVQLPQQSGTATFVGVPSSELFECDRERDEGFSGSNAGSVSPYPTAVPANMHLQHQQRQPLQRPEQPSCVPTNGGHSLPQPYPSDPNQLPPKASSCALESRNGSAGVSFGHAPFVANFSTVFSGNSEEPAMVNSAKPQSSGGIFSKKDDPFNEEFFNMLNSSAGPDAPGQQQQIDSFW